MAAFGADRLRVMNAGAEPGLTLAATLAPQRQAIESFADQGGLRLSNQLARVWDDRLPLILPPAEEDGLGVSDPQFERRHEFLLHQARSA